MVAALLAQPETRRPIGKFGEDCLSEASSAAAQLVKRWREPFGFYQRDVAGTKWFGVLLPKQKDLVCRGETLQIYLHSNHRLIITIYLIGEFHESSCEWH